MQASSRAPARAVPPIGEFFLSAVKEKGAAGSSPFCMHADMAERRLRFYPRSAVTPLRDAWTLLHSAVLSGLQVRDRQGMVPSMPLRNCDVAAANIMAQVPNGAAQPTFENLATLARETEKAVKAHVACMRHVIELKNRLAAAAPEPGGPWEELAPAAPATKILRQQFDRGVVTGEADWCRGMYLLDVLDRTLRGEAVPGAHVAEAETLLQHDETLQYALAESINALLRQPEQVQGIAEDRVIDLVAMLPARAAGTLFIPKAAFEPLAERWPRNVARRHIEIARTNSARYEKLLGTHGMPKLHASPEFLIGMLERLEGTFDPKAVQPKGRIADREGQYAARKVSNFAVCARNLGLDELIDVPEAQLSRRFGPSYEGSLFQAALCLWDELTPTQQSAATEYCRFDLDEEDLQYVYVEAQTIAAFGACHAATCTAWAEDHSDDDKAEETNEVMLIKLGKLEANARVWEEFKRSDVYRSGAFEDVERAEVMQWFQDMEEFLAARQPKASAAVAVVTPPADRAAETKVADPQPAPPSEAAKRSVRKAGASALVVHINRLDLGKNTNRELASAPTGRQWWDSRNHSGHHVVGKHAYLPAWMRDALSGRKGKKSLHDDAVVALRAGSR